MAFRIDVTSVGANGSAAVSGTPDQDFTHRSSHQRWTMAAFEVLRTPTGVEAGIWTLTLDDPHGTGGQLHDWRASDSIDDLTFNLADQIPTDVPARSCPAIP